MLLSTSRSNVFSINAIELLISRDFSARQKKSTFSRFFRAGKKNRLFRDYIDFWIFLWLDFFWILWYFLENFDFFDFLYWIWRFSSSHISSTTHPFGVFFGLISFSFLHRMLLIQDQRSCVLLCCRTECHNIAKRHQAKFHYLLINLIYSFFGFCGSISPQLRILLGCLWLGYLQLFA